MQKLVAVGDAGRQKVLGEGRRCILRSQPVVAVGTVDTVSVFVPFVIKKSSGCIRIRQSPKAPVIEFIPRGKAVIKPRQLVVFEVGFYAQLLPVLPVKATSGKITFCTID